MKPSGGWRAGLPHCENTRHFEESVRSWNSPPNQPLCRSARPLSIRSETMTPKNTICLWYDKDAEEAARFYAATFPDSAVRRRAPRAGRLSRRQEGRRADGRVHRPGHSLHRPQRRARLSSTAKRSPSRSPPTTRKKPTATGTPSSATAARKARAAGARTNGACPGRSRRAR